MKYFTPKWWEGDDSDGHATVDAYWRHLDSIRSKLPPELARFAYDFSLHDAEVTASEWDASAGTLRLCFDGYRNGPSPDDCLKRKFVLCYGQVSHISGLNSGRLSEYGDFGYTEFDLLDDAVFEHRMLFENAEICIRFSDFAFEFSD